MRRRHRIEVALDDELFARMEAVRGRTAKQEWLERAVRRSVRQEENVLRGPLTERDVEIVKREMQTYKP